MPAQLLDDRRVVLLQQLLYMALFRVPLYERLLPLLYLATRQQLRRWAVPVLASVVELQVLVIVTASLSVLLGLAAAASP